MISRKELIRAAKSNISDKLILRSEELKSDMNTLAEQLSESEGMAGYGALEKEYDAAHKEYMSIQSEIEELHRKKGSVKKELKRSLEWKADPVEVRSSNREKSRVLIRDNNALHRVKQSEKNKKKVQCADWLYEGALVKHRSSVNALIVLAVYGESVDVLDGSQRRRIRSVALRPFDLE